MIEKNYVIIYFEKNCIRIVLLIGIIFVGFGPFSNTTFLATAQDTNFFDTIYNVVCPFIELIEQANDV